MPTPRRRRIVTTPVEHHAVLDAVEWLAEHEGAEVSWLPVDADGSVAPAALREALQDHDDVALVSIMWANNEVGTIMPIAELAAIAAEFDVPMHSDAIQAVGQLPVDFGASGLSAMSVAAHKFGGPTVLVRWCCGATPPAFRCCTGAGRSAMSAPAHRMSPGRSRWRRPCDAWKALLPTARACRRCATARGRRAVDIDDAYLNGAGERGRLPGNAHFTFRGCEGDSLLMLLDAKGIECSTGSACTAGVRSRRTC